jgi:hypothetical protein
MALQTLLSAVIVSMASGALLSLCAKISLIDFDLKEPKGF